MNAALKVPTIFSAVDKFSSVVKGMSKTMDSFAHKGQRAINKIDSAINRLTPSLSGVQKEFLSFASAAAVSAAIFSGISFGAKSLIDYETALHSLEAVTGESSDKFRTQIESIAIKTKKSAIDVASSFEVIGSAMSEYLNDPKALGQITEAGITLSKASRMQLQPTLEALTSVMNQFKLSAASANDTINRLTAGEIVGSVSTSKIAAGLQEFGANAFAANVKLSESVALLETLGKQMDHSKIAVGARNILNILSSAKGLPKEAVTSLKQHGVNLSFLMDKSKSLGDRLTELSKIQGDAVAISNVFGKENMTAGNVIFSNLDTYKQWEIQIKNTNKAQQQAAVNSNTFSNAVSEVKNSFVNTLVSTDKLNSGLELMKSILFFVSDNMSTILNVGAKLLIGFAAWKTLVISVEAAMWLYNLSLAVNGTLQGTSTAMTVAANIVYGLYAGLVIAATAAQWLLNAALSANPIGLVIIAIAALIALVVVIVKKWNDWGAALSMFLGPLGLVISLIQSFRRNWDMVVAAFKTEGILGGLKAIGKVFLDALIMPLQQALSLVAKLTGAKWAVSAVADLQALRNAIGVNTVTDENGRSLNAAPVINTKRTIEESRTASEITKTQFLTIDFKNMPKGVEAVGQGQGATLPGLTPTFGF